jgi:SAM-dependent methyltransferase
MENLAKCLVCGSDKINNERSCRDFVASDELFDLSRCLNCSFLFTNPRPDTNEIGRYYQSERYVSHAGDKRGFSFIYKVYDFVRDFSIKNKISLIKKYHDRGRLMDLGCGLGYFLHGVHLDKTFDVIGVDISVDAITYVKNRFGHSVYQESHLDRFDSNSFDVITQWHVLEHVHLLNERLVQLKRLLSANGTLFIAVPNSDSWDAKHYKEFWDGYDVPRHLYHFNQQSFGALMEKHGFKVIETKPLLFDAPYISMRSEVHKGNKLVFLRGGIKGLVSTVFALKKKEYSSLLFVVKRA